mmetsp:Transcript_10397/g.38565  ORF Transcript_10397/g.38565 Transcript_10397/m.38565 type:complete len:231 (-) Transcript_10397:542-1234(-)
MPSSMTSAKDFRADPLKILLNPNITLKEPSMVSMASFRNRCDKQGPITRWISAAVTSVRPSYATSAFALRVTTMSPRKPSTSTSAQTDEIFSARSRSMVTEGKIFCAALIFARSAFVSSAHPFANPSGSSSNAMRFFTSCTRCALSKIVVMLHAMPNRSRSCGRSSPSSGFPLPIMMNFAGCVIEIPSRSTVFHPPAAESRITSTRESSNKFTSSMYSNPRLALARRPAS